MDENYCDKCKRENFEDDEMTNFEELDISFCDDCMNEEYLGK